MIQLKKTLLTLVALFAMTTGAWADETLLLTIESKDYFTFKSGSMTFDDKVTITFSSSVYNDGDSDGWYSEGTASLLTVTGINGYTITSCKFYTYNGIAANGYTVEGESPSVYLYGGKVYIDDSKSVSIGTYGVTKIEVYTAAAPAGTALTPDATRKVWTLDAMPAGNVELQVAYFPGMLTLGPKADDNKGGIVELVEGSSPVEWTPETWTNVSTQGQHDALTSGDITLSTTGWLVKADDGNLTLYSADNEYDHQTLTFSTTGDGFTRIELTMTSDASNQNPHITPADGWTFSGKSAVWEGEATKSLVCQNCTTTVAKIVFYCGAAQADNIETDTDGNIYVKSDTKFKVKATPEEGYRLVSLSDGTNTYDVDADGIATVTMPEGDADLTLTATFSDEFELTFDDVNFKTNQNITVKVGDADKTLGEDGKLSVKSGQTVTLTAKQGYKFRSVEAKKVVPVKTFNCAGVELIYEDGDTWAKVIERNPGKIYDDYGWIGRSDTNFFLIEGEVLNNGNQIIHTDKIVDPTATYSWQAG